MKVNDVTAESTETELQQRLVARLVASTVPDECARTLAELVANLHGGWSAVMYAPDPLRTSVHACVHHPTRGAMSDFYQGVKRHAKTREQLRAAFCEYGFDWDDPHASEFQVGHELLTFDPLLDENGDTIGHLVTGSPRETNAESLAVKRGSLVALGNVVTWCEMRATSIGDSASQQARFSEVSETLFHRANGSLASLGLLAELADFSLPDNRQKLHSLLRKVGDDLAWLDEIMTNWNRSGTASSLKAVTEMIRILVNDLTRDHRVDVVVSQSKADQRMRLWVPALGLLGILESILRYMAKRLAVAASRNRKALQVDVISLSHQELKIAVSASGVSGPPTGAPKDLNQQVVCEVIARAAGPLGGRIDWSQDFFRADLKFER